METIQERAEKMSDQIRGTYGGTHLTVGGDVVPLSKYLAAELQAAVDTERERCAITAHEMAAHGKDGFEIAAAIREGDE